MSDPAPAAAIVVPTHDHAATLDLAVRSALEQTVADVEVLVVGDGVGDDTRDVVEALRREDPRLRFLDLPKGPNHGEVHRHTAIEASRAPVICYLCDDDLLLPEHVESMLALLEGADLANSQNGYLDAEGRWHHYFSDLASPECREWILQPGQNVVSLTGTAHTAAAYRRLPHGWRTTPADDWPDRHMWCQFLAEPWVRGATANRVTALQLPSHIDGRESWEPARRRAELERWRASLGTPEGRSQFEASVRSAVLAQAADQFLRRDQLQKDLHRSELERDRLREQAAAAAHEARMARATLADIERTRTWRVRTTLRRLLG